MYRLIIFQNGGTVELDKNAVAVPTSAANELIVKECIDKNMSTAVTHIRVGKAGEFTAKLHRIPENAVNIALIYPTSLKFTDPESVIEDIAKIYANCGQDKIKLNSLVDMRLKAFKPTSHESPHVPVNSSNVTDLSIENKDFSAKSTDRTRKSKKSKKKGRNWDGIDENSDDESLDFSSKTSGDPSTVIAQQLDAIDLGQKSRDGFVVKELSDELGDILSGSSDQQSSAKMVSEPFGFLKRFVGGKKLDNSDLNSVLTAMEDHLVTRNVAKEVAGSICEQVRKDLVGTSTNSWTTIKATVRDSIKRVLQKILTPATSTDLLAGIKRKIKTKPKQPYVISVVGVNGVGKSTNLGKLGFWFLQNDFNVLVAACDTFRSGAVEQLKVHVSRLQQMKNTQGHVELFDRGYGKDAAVIAKQAVEYAAKNDFDVVLIDTAGRRHNDDRLMSSLEKFGNLANPDKIIMVGEALVGTDSVEQARNFDSAFGRARGLDFFLISKCDTVGEMLGTLVNVTYATGVPVLFVGVGQQYTDLRTLNVDWAVDKLMS